jgi:hypothetical protein
MPGAQRPPSPLWPGGVTCLRHVPAAHWQLQLSLQARGITEFLTAAAKANFTPLNSELEDRGHCPGPRRSESAPLSTEPRRGPGGVFWLIGSQIWVLNPGPQVNSPHPYLDLDDRGHSAGSYGDSECTCLCNPGYCQYIHFQSWTGLFPACATMILLL